MRMKLNLARTLPIAVALRSAPAVIGAAADVRKLTGVEELASFGLTLDEFEEVRASESPPDFTLPSGGETDQLWLDAAVFEYEAAMSYASDYAATSPGYHPYVVCSTLPGLSGREREAAVNETFQNTPGISASDYYAEGNQFHNDMDTSCGVLRAYNDTIALVYEANPEAAAHLSVNPLHPSMKMTVHTVDILRSWFNKEVTGDVVSIGGAVTSASSAALGQTKVKTMGLFMLLCPGVKNFGVADVPDDQIAEDVRSFVTGEGGETVKDLSFYYHRVSGMDGEKAVHTERMGEWSAAIDQVANNWTRDDGSNPCLDTILGENMVFTVKERVLEVNAKLSIQEGIKLAESLGFSEEDLETCIWYMTYSLALCPMVCTLEPRTTTKTLCEDYSSDLSKCPVAEDVGAVDSGGGGDASSSSRLELGPWRNTGALTALFVSSLLVFAIL